MLGKINENQLNYLLTYLCCPKCLSSFDLVTYDSVDEEIVDGKLICEHCNIQFPILDGTPLILDKVGQMANTQKAFSKQWRLQSKGNFEIDTIYSQSESEELNEFKNTFDITHWNEIFLQEKPGIYLEVEGQLKVP